jgi:hypothetical protein
MGQTTQTLNLLKFEKVLNEALKIVHQRGKDEGRNLARDFWDTFPHGLQDMTFMVRDKADRILGAEEMARYDVIRDNCLDIINYAAFIVVWLDREHPPRATYCPNCRSSNIDRALGDEVGRCVDCGSTWSPP